MQKSFYMQKKKKLMIPNGRYTDTESLISWECGFNSTALMVDEQVTT